MVKNWKSIVLATLVGTCLALATAFVAGAAEVPNLSITIPKVDKAPVIDGNLDDAAWVSASILGGKLVVDVDDGASIISKYPRVAYLCYDKDAIYLGVVSFAPDVTKLVGDQPSWWNNDEVELFVDPNKKGAFTQFGITSAGVLSHDTIKGVVKKDGIRWVVEAAFPWSSMNAAAPKAGDIWGINLNGHQIAPGEQWLAFNTTYGSFLNPARFATATFK